MIASNDQFMSSNANRFYEMLDCEFSRASRYRYDVTLLFIKLCNLNEISSTYGQLTAALILSKIESLIKNNIRSSDQQFIYGSDEFMIIAPQTSKSAAKYMILKLKRLMEGFCFSNDRDTSVTITPKFGIASYPYDSLTKDGVVKMADHVTSD